MKITEYMFEVNYSVYYPDTNEVKRNRFYQICATSELNAAVLIGQMYSVVSTGKRIDIHGIKKVIGYERQVEQI